MNFHISASDLRIAKALQSALDCGVTGISMTAYFREFPSGTRPLFPYYSISKGITALAVLIQAERGFLHVDDPVAKYWSEYAVNGKDKTTIEYVLSHRAGIPQMPDGLTQ
ncbi:serine hydrolase domain-containing protein [Aspergillus affinis]|uniref:serine hydrolase domain-containing protein n=1 Tax=Aspergillus affinis TaxID=1070780 RepID=UPI0022FED146|nr:uncharacterized protein KD926_006485 [Aspergillus affinis]KAI9041761.1 hypothetical protein KD926_006485 [Aspergillus affinis]